MKIILKSEEPVDYEEVENITREAFWNNYGPGCNEHYLVHLMREHSKFVEGLDYVALIDDKIVGNIMYVESLIIDDKGPEYEVLGLGPISVLPEYQGKGIGAKLIKHTVKLAYEMGYRAIFLLGDPEYYEKQGFEPAEKYNIRTSDNMYAAALLVYPLYEDSLKGITGRYIEGSIYELDDDEAEEFDKKFPPKEKLTGVKMQSRFNELAKMTKAYDE